MKVPLQGTTIAKLADGVAGKVIDKALEAVFKDILDRGEDGIARKLTIQLSFQLVGGKVEIDTQVKTTSPAYRPAKTQARLDAAAGGLIFNPEVSHNPDQTTFSDIEDDEK